MKQTRFIFHILIPKNNILILLKLANLVTPGDTNNNPMWTNSHWINPVKDNARNKNPQIINSTEHFLTANFLYRQTLSHFVNQCEELRFLNAWPIDGSQNKSLSQASEKHFISWRKKLSFPIYSEAGIRQFRILSNFFDKWCP